MNNVLFAFGAFIVTSLFVQTPSTAPGPYTFKADVLGESLSQYQQNNKDCPSSALKTDKDRGVVYCEAKNTGFTYAGVTVLRKNSGFLHDRLYLVTITLPHGQYNTVAAALAEKFGKPKETFMERPTILTVLEALSGKEKSHAERLDVPEIAEIKTWANGVSEISLQEYDLSDGTLQTSTVVFSLNDLAKEAGANMQRAMDANKKKARSDM